jgi:hypothetical protein
MNEADRKRKLVAEINALPGGYARRLEDRFAVGLLDLIIKFPELPWCWAEGKLVNGFKFGPSERQWVEGERIRATGTQVVLIGWKAGVMYLSPWVKQADVRNCFFGAVDWVAAFEAFLETRKQT